MQSYEFPPLGGGGAKVVFGLSKQLVELGYDVDLVTMKFQGLERYEQVRGIHVHRIPCIRTSQSVCYMPEMLSYILTAIPTILKLTKKNAYALNHTHFILPDGLASFVVKQLTGLPYVITVHGSDVPGYNPDRFIRQHKLFSPIWRKVVQSASQIVSPSETLKSLVRNRCPSVPITLIPNAIDKNKFLPNGKKKNRVLVVSRLFARKGIQYFLKALAELKGECPFEVDIVGEGPHRTYLEQMAQNLKEKVKFWGHLDNNSPDLRRLYETSSIFVFPSEAENFPIVLLEAMAAGMAIITTGKTGCAEVVGESAILVNPRDSVGLRKALIQLMVNPDLCDRLGELARERLVSNFSWEVIARRYSTLYENYVSESKAVV